MNKPKFRLNDLNILIPMAGDGIRFKQAGYMTIKPMIKVNNKPMVQIVVDGLGLDANFIYVVQNAHYEKYNLKYFLNSITPKCTIVLANSLTEGAACTTLLAKEFINNDKPLLISNSDQLIEWDPIVFYNKMIDDEADGGIVTFRATHPKWSFAKLGDDDNVIAVAEKTPISDIATAGVYYYKSGAEYVKYAEQMITKNVRVNNEFYVCPIYNEYIMDGKKIKTYELKKMWNLGDPESLEYFRINYKPLD